MSEKPGCQISDVHVTRLHVSAPLPLLFRKLLFLQDTERKKGLPDLLISKCGLITLSSSKESSVSRELAFTNGCPDDISYPSGHVLLLQRGPNWSMNCPCKAPGAHTAWNFAYPIVKNMACKMLSCIGGQPNTTSFGNCWCLLLQSTVFCRVTDITWHLREHQAIETLSTEEGNCEWDKTLLYARQTHYKFSAKPSWCCLLNWEYQLQKTTLLPHIKGFQKQAGWSCSTLSAKAKKWDTAY